MLLAGGRDKKLPWQEFAGEATHRARQVITFGEAGPMIAQQLEEYAAKSNGSGARGGERRLEAVTQVGSLEEAVRVASRVSQPGDVVLLSPGGTSFDAFRDFAERGDRFKALVQTL